jgi:hypothetical protein
LNYINRITKIKGGVIMNRFAIKTFSVLAMVSASGLAMADGSGGVDIAKNMSVLFDLAWLIAFAIGFFLLANGIYKVYDSAKGRGEVKVGQAMLEVLIGVFLTSIGWFYQLIKGSFISGSKNGVTLDQGQMALALDSVSASAASAVGQAKGFTQIMPMHTVEGIIAFIFLVGFINLIGGVYALKDINNSRSEHPVMKPVVKIIAGAICMNILWFGCLVSGLFGFASLCVE